jgi:acetolactate synthase-1/3 small subunit
MRHIISVLVENEFGVLARVSGLFSGRGFNIESLCVAETTDPTVSRITLVTSGDDQVVEQITKQLNKLINVIKVSDFSNSSHVERELVLVKVGADERTRGEVMNVVNIFRGKVVDVANRSYVVEVTGAEEKVNAFIDLLKPYGIKEIVRTGIVAMYRGAQVLGEAAKEEKAKPGARPDRPEQPAPVVPEVEGIEFV